MSDYVDPVSRLLDLGGVHRNADPSGWANYLEMGIGTQHVPELIRMVQDRDLNLADQESVIVWAPLHAWRALGQLGATEAAPALVRLFDLFPDDDWLPMEMIEVFGMLGPEVIPALSEFLSDNEIKSDNRMAVPDCLAEVGVRHPSVRDQCVEALTTVLQQYSSNDRELNAFLVSGLEKLKATESIDSIREAFSTDSVELGVLGDVEDVEIHMGLRTVRETPAPRYTWFREGEEPDDDYDEDEYWEPPATFVRSGPKVGRNDPCPCGSGRKFKKCCLQ